MEELRTKNTYALVLMALGFSLGINAQDSITYTLPQCIDLAMKQNQALMVSGFQVQNSGSAQRQAAAAVLPAISGYANQGISTGKSINPYTNTFINQEAGTGQYGINASLNLFSGLSSIHTIQQTALAHKADKMDYEQVKIDVSIQVSMTYLQILSNEAMVNQALSQMAATQTQLDRLKTLQANDAVNPSVFYDTRGQLANDKLSLINARAALLTAKLNLGQLLGISFPPNARFEKAGSENDLKSPVANADLYKEVYQSIPGIRSSELRSTSALKRLHAMRGAYFPVLSLNGSLGSNYSSAAFSQRLIGTSDEATGAYVNSGGSMLSVFEPRNNYQSEAIGFSSQVKNNFNTYVGLSLQVPIFNGLRNKTQAELAKIAYHQAEVIQKNTSVRYKAVIDQLSNDLQNAYERYEVINQQVSDYEASFKVATLKFEKGSFTTVEYTTAKNNFDKARMNLISIRYDCILRAKVLDLYRNPGK